MAIEGEPTEQVQKDLILQTRKAIQDLAELCQIASMSINGLAQVQEAQLRGVSLRFGRLKNRLNKKGIVSVETDFGERVETATIMRNWSEIIHAVLNQTFSSSHIALFEKLRIQMEAVYKALSTIEQVQGDTILKTEIKATIDQTKKRIVQSANRGQ